MFIATAYVMAYFFLTGFVTLILANSADYQTDQCSSLIVIWFKLSVSYYLIGFLVCIFVLYQIKRHGLRSEIVNMGAFEITLQVYEKSWAYIVLVIIDVINLSITIWGTFIFQNSLSYCYFEEPVLTNFILILIILGYIYFLRVVPLIFHYKYGVRIYRHIRQRFRCFRRYDHNLKEKFPIYQYNEYKKLLQESSPKDQLDANNSNQSTKYHSCDRIQESDSKNLQLKNISQEQFQTIDNTPFLEQSDISKKDNLDSLSFPFPQGLNATTQQTRNEIQADEGDVCPICCDNFKDEQDIVLMPCNIKHIYHPQCIYEWLCKNIQCPLCKEVVFKDAVVRARSEEGISSNQNQVLEQQIVNEQVIDLENSQS
eukprot:403349272